MSLIIHRCETCGHPDIFHNNGNECCYSHCAQGRHAPQYGPSEVIPTWDTATGAPIEIPAQPGTKHAAFGPIPLPLCGCDQCVALYAELTGAVA